MTTPSVTVQRGVITITKVFTYKNAILTSQDHGRLKLVEEWDWLNSPSDSAWCTSIIEFKHDPGYTEGFIRYYISLCSPNAIICSSGIDGQIKMSSDLIQSIEKRGIKCYYLDTSSALDLFNQLASMVDKILFFCSSA